MAARSDEPIVQFATRIPLSLLQRVRVLAVQRGTSIVELVEAAIREKLARERGRRR